MAEVDSVHIDSTGDDILKNEFYHTLSNMKSGKTAGIDGIQAELITNAGRDVKEALFKLVSHIHKTGDIPNDFGKVY